MTVQKGFFSGASPSYRPKNLRILVTLDALVRNPAVVQGALNEPSQFTRAQWQAILSRVPEYSRDRYEPFRVRLEIEGAATAADKRRASEEKRLARAKKGENDGEEEAG